MSQNVHQPDLCAFDEDKLHLYTYKLKCTKSSLELMCKVQ